MPCAKPTSCPLPGSCRQTPPLPLHSSRIILGPIQLALGRLDAPKQAALLQDLEQLWIDNNLAADGENHTVIINEYLEAVAMKR